ncbi:hypothetical protein VUR80DRAFT_6097 [Thermomyces stellatus]
MAAADLPAGRPGNLTAEEEEKLRRLWALVLRVLAVDDATPAGQEATVSNAPSEQTTTAHLEKGKKKRTLFSRKNNGASSCNSQSQSASSVIDPSSLIEGDADDKYGQTQQFHEALSNMSPDSIRETLWSMVKHDDPDALLLRFLRARKWDVEKALVMLISTMNWRATEMHVDDDIMKNGEGGAAEAEKGHDGPDKVLGHEFLDQMRMGKSFLHGTDKAGRPICFVRVRLHRQGDHSEEALERHTVFVIETCRMLLKPPIDTATIIFDMTGFSMANMDYTPVKFMVKCFEANYPESLGTVLIYKAPWIFQGIWKIIRGWLDPVVASKVHFLNNSKDMEAFVDLKGLPREIDGYEDWEYRYEEPVEGENAKMADTATRDRLLDARRQLIEEYERETLDWVKGDTGHAAARKESRNATAARLRENYWEVDPYIRARSVYDRIGMIKPGGGLDFYATTNGTPGKGAPKSAAGTTPDDVD